LQVFIANLIGRDACYVAAHFDPALRVTQETAGAPRVKFARRHWRVPIAGRSVAPAT
jgi:hypothetical protein